MRVKATFRAVEAGAGSEDRRKVILSKEKLSHRKVYACLDMGNQRSLYPALIPS